MSAAAAGRPPAAGRGGARFAWAASIALGALLGGAAVLDLVRLLSAMPGPGTAFDPVAWARGGLAAACFGVAGVALGRRLPRHPVAWLCLTIGLGEAVALAATAYAEYGLVAAPGALPGAAWALWLTQWTWAPAYMVALTLVLQVFPDGRWAGPRWRLFGWATVAVIVAGSLCWALVPYDRLDFPLPAQYSAARNPVGVPGAEVAVEVVLVPFLLCAVGSFACLVVRWRRADEVARQQIRVVLAAAGAVLVLVMVSQFALPSAAAVAVVGAAAMVPVPVALAVAVLRYRLWDLDVVINRSLVYGGLAVAVVGGYLAVVTLLGGLLGAASPAVGTLVVALLAHPLYEWLRRSVNRLRYGDRDDPQGALLNLGRRLADSAGPEQALAGVAETVTRTLRVPYAAVTAPGVQPVSAGAPSGDEVELPLVYQGRSVGTLTVAPRGRGERFTAADRRLLDGLASQVAAAVHSVRLTGELKDSREQLVLAREEERRRLRRDLHDELGPALAAVGLQLETVGDLAGTDPGAARALAERLGGQVREALRDVRRIVDDLRPPALDDLGLAGALRQQAARFAGPEFAVTIEVGELGALPAAVDVAAYRIVLEALNNATRHAAGTRCDVVVRRQAAGVEIEVRDDGVGIRPDWSAGVGLASMHRRAAELGGRCILGAPASGTGTVVRATLPVAC